ncbi:MAG TPA: ABC transporter ATP-binding protein [Candidatus Limnocylindria bacterium]|nr:ABC transporter ATP-binding protein [Candidatus Limnocylindria bacterium]
MRTPTRWLRVVRDVSLELNRGEITALVGETGSGKTMTALSLIRLLPVGARLTGGTVRLGTDELTSLSEKDLMKTRGSRISMVFQDPLAALNPVRTIGFQITEPMRVHLAVGGREARTRAAALLGELGMPDPFGALRRYPHELSGGMRQRALIAVALSCDPDVLLADEPTTALDVTIQAQILELLRREVDQRGLAVLLVTHDLGVAALVADRVAVMYAGAIVESGPVLDVLRQPNHPYTRGLVGCVPRVDVRLRPLPTLPGGVQGVWEIPSGCRFAPRCPHAIAACRDVEPQLEHVGPGHASACWVFAPADRRAP